ncbi:MAG: alpha-ketoglutarate-dependent dioxygenase AlkB [Congregibacter sp.]
MPYAEMVIKKEHIELPGAQLDFLPQPDLGQPASSLFDALRRDIEWRSESITLFGKTMPQPRLIAWYGDADAHYGYSGKRLAPQAWTEALLAVRARLEGFAGTEFNSVLANLYRNEQDSMGLHADDEPELGSRPVIASLSLGETRTFRLKHRTRRDIKPLKLELPSGSVLIMRGDTQQHWKHEIPKSRTPCGPRINLTFRLVRRGMA